MNPSLARTRIILAGCGGLILTLLAGGIFDRWVPALLLAAIVPTALALVVRQRRPLVRLAAALIALVGSVAAIVAISGGDGRDLVDSFGAGVQRMLSTDWPSPDRPDLIGSVGLLIAITVVLSTELARRPRWHLFPLAPLVLCHMAITGLSAPLGVRLHWLAPVAVVFTVFASLKPRSGAAATTEGLRERLLSLRGEWRVIPLVLVGAIVAIAVSLPVTAARRADPRRNDPATQTSALLDPIESTLAMQALDPPLPIFEIASDDVLPTRWRTSALDSYDGQRWTPALTIRPIGRRLGPDIEPSVSYTLNVLNGAAVLLPLAGTPITADGQLETDADRTVVRLAERIPVDEPLEIRTAVAPTSPDAGRIGTRQVDERVSGLTVFATELAAEGTVLEQLRNIESAMRDDFVLASNASGAGQQQALIERFLQDTQRGTAEQFATGFVLLARSLGVDARVATGFVLDSSAADDGSLVLTSRDAAVWPEVRVIDAGWLAFDPVPTEEDSNLAPPPEAPAVQTPAAAQPPVAPPVEPEADPDLANIDDADTDDARLSSIGRWATRVAWGFALLVLPVVLAIIVVLAIKRRRRRRRLEADAATAQINGAWAVATDRLVDAGLAIPGSATDGEIARSGTPLAPAAERELHRLASLSSSVTFGAPTRPDLLAQDAAACLDRVETSMADSRSRLDRLRWELSLRSLRRSTRSPVRTDSSS